MTRCDINMLRTELFFFFLGKYLASARDILFLGLGHPVDGISDLGYGKTL